MTALRSTSAFGEEWIPISETTEGMTYYDVNSMKSRENWITVVTMIDLNSNQMGILSRQTHLEIECNEDRYRILRQTLFEENMGNGTGYSTTFGNTAKFLALDGRRNILELAGELCSK